MLLVLLLQEKKVKRVSQMFTVLRSSQVFRSICLLGGGGMAVQMGCQAINSSYLE